MKITRLMAILFAILSLALVLTLVGCQNNGGEDGTDVETNAQDVCKHESTYVNDRCEKVCVECGKVLETDLHGLTIVNAKCQEVCSVCGKVYKTDLHSPGAINDECQRPCIRCGVICETDLHDEKIINDKCEEVCGRCGKVYATGKHDAGAYGENCDKSCTRCGTTLATGEHAEIVINDKCEEVCVRCNKVMATGVHAEKVVNDQLQEVCSRCGEVYVECVHDEGVIENCVKSCGNCGEVLDAEAHGEKIINDNCDEVCADCGKIYAADVHGEIVLGADCSKSCSRCGDVVETEAHGELVITANCEQVCSVCFKVFASDVHEDSVETYVDDYFSNIRTYTKACARCGGNVEYSYTVQLGAKKPEVIVTAAQLAAIEVSNKFEKTVLSEDGSYATFTGKAGTSDAFITAFVGKGKATGQYILIKYRTNIDAAWEMWAASETGKTSATGGENFGFNAKVGDGWQVAVIDAAKAKSATVKKNEDGKYYLDFFRWDVFNTKSDNVRTLDIAYIAIADSISDLTAMCGEFDTVPVVSGTSGGGNVGYDVYPESGTASGGANAPSVKIPYYRYCVDYVNSLPNGVAYGTVNGNRGVVSCDISLSTLRTGLFQIRGWAAAYSDIATYEYSLDDGSTWLPVVDPSSYSACSSKGVLAAVHGDAPDIFDGTSAIQNGSFSLFADVSSFYGKTVTVMFSMILENGDRLGMARYTNVYVDTCGHTSTTFDEECKEYCDYCEEYIGMHNVVQTATVNGENTTYFSGCTLCDYTVYNFTIVTPDKMMTPYDIHNAAMKNDHGPKMTQGVQDTDGTLLLNTYKTYSGGALTTENYFHLFRDNTVKARYLVIKYYTNSPNQCDFFVGTTGSGAVGGDSFGWQFLKEDGTRIAVIDLNQSPKFDATVGVAKYIRFDVFNEFNEAMFDSGNYSFNVHYIAFYDDIADAAAVVGNEAENGVKCEHNAALNVTKNGCETWCGGCDIYLSTSHLASSEVITDNGSVRTISGECARCGHDYYSYDLTIGATKPNVFLSAAEIARLVNTNGSSLGVATVSDDGTYAVVKNKVGAGDGYFSLINNSAGVNTGRYMVVRYKTTFGNGFQWFIQSSGKGHTDFYTQPASNGQWVNVIIDLDSVKGDAFVSADKATWIRWDIHNDAKNYECSVEVAYVAFADDIKTLTDLNAIDSFVKFTESTGYHGPQGAVVDNPYFSADFLAQVSSDHTNARDILVDKTGANNLPFVRYYSKDVSGEERFAVWSSGSTGRTFANTGNYIVYMYRKPSGDPYDFVDIFLNSNLPGPNGSGDSNSRLDYIADGNWHIKVVDLTDNMDQTKPAYYDPTVGVASIYIDWFNEAGRTAGETYVDVAFLAMFDTEAQIIEYYKSFMQKYGVKTCAHDFTGDIQYVTDNDENTQIALVAQTCLVCGKALDVSPAPFAVNGETVKANPGFSSESLGATSSMYVYKKGCYAYTTDTITYNADGVVGVSGWGGVLGGATYGAYQIVDAATGEVIVNWTQASGNATNVSGAVQNAVNGMVPGAQSFRYGFSVDISGNAELKAAISGKTVNIVFAFIALEGVGNDVYVPCFTIANFVCD